MSQYSNYFQNFLYFRDFLNFRDFQYFQYFLGFRDFRDFRKFSRIFEIFFIFDEIFSYQSTLYSNYFRNCSFIIGDEKVKGQIMSRPRRGSFYDDVTMVYIILSKF